MKKKTHNAKIQLLLEREKIGSRNTLVAEYAEFIRDDYDDIANFIHDFNSLMVNPLSDKELQMIIDAFSR